jgi:hypothetical protein
MISPNVLLRLLVATVLAVVLTTCASHGTVESRQADCSDETCVGMRMRDIGIPDAERYLFARRALSQGLKPVESPSPFWQAYATLASFVGNYGEAADRYPSPKRSEDPVKDGYIYARAANPTIVALARNTRAVFINEAHAYPQTRAAIYTLLRPLREEGYNVLALEGLTMAPAPASGSDCMDSVIFDKDLAKRGFPVRSSGFYIREPIFAEIIKEALRLDYTIVGYETSDETDSGIENREQRQAQNLACVLEKLPSAKILAIAGYSHVSKQRDYKVPGGMMAARFKALTKVEPLTIDTTKLLEVDRSKFLRRGRPLSEIAANSDAAAQPYALWNAAGRPYDVDGYDLVLLLSQLTDRAATGPSWLELDGARRRTVVSLSACGTSEPCLVEAYLQGNEQSDIPADSCVASGKEETNCNLFLAPGSYAVRYRNADAAMLGSISVLVR